jgi:RNA polymerase sigma factor (sigma-70 family)
MAKDLDRFIPTRKSLLTRLKNWDDQEGWREFFDTYWRLIYSVATKSGFHDAEAQDLVQDTIISVAKKMRHFRYDPCIGSFKAWLLLITRSRITERLRKKRLPVAEYPAASGTTTGTGLLERIPDPAGPGLDALWDVEWRNNLLQLALEKVKQQITPRQFQIFDLYVLQELPLDKITDALGISTGQVYLAKHRVSRLLQNELKKLERRIA